MKIKYSGIRETFDEVRDALQTGKELTGFSAQTLAFVATSIDFQIHKKFVVQLEQFLKELILLTSLELQTFLVKAFQM